MAVTIPTTMRRFLSSLGASPSPEYDERSMQPPTRSPGSLTNDRIRSP